MTGVVVWGLIFYAVVRFRRRSDDEIPVQTRYNLPLEIFYTIAPVIMVIVFFNHTVQGPERRPARRRPRPTTSSRSPASSGPGRSTTASASWTTTADDDRFDDNFSYDEYVYEAGTGSYIPELWLPVDETTRFNLLQPRRDPRLRRARAS